MNKDDRYVEMDRAGLYLFAHRRTSARMIEASKICELTVGMKQNIQL